MDVSAKKQMLRRLLDEVTVDDESMGVRFASLRDVDAKVREARIVISSLPGHGERLSAEMEKDDDFEKQSRRVRLEAVAHYCKTALRFLETGALTEKKTLAKAPDTSKLTVVLPDLDTIIQERWLEAQKCQHAGAYTAAVILMGSVLEALLLARVHLDPAGANRSRHAPKNKDGRNLAFHDWNLNSLIDVAVDLRWLKVDRGRFSHALRDSRNVVHPWYHAQIQADFDQATCQTCWTVLNAAVGDLVASL